MKFKTLLVLLLAGLWGAGSWWWYTCKIKGFCQPDQSSLAQTQNDAQTTDADKVAQLAETSPAVKSDDSAEKSENKPADTPTEDVTQKEEATQEKTEQATDLPDTENPSDTDGNAEESAIIEGDSEKDIQPPSAETDNTEKDTTADTATTDESNKPVEEISAEPVQEPEPIDNDGDGIPNTVETRLGLNANNSDSDGDGVNDFLETGDDFENPIDSDNDNIINALDTDDDGDGDPTSNEAPDPNQDGDPDDAQDVDKDGIPDYLDPKTSKMSEDGDGDGISDGREKVLGTNPTLTDSDGDGLSDSIEIEGEKDSDNDGTIDALDPDDDDDGIMTAMEGADPDGDGDPKDALDGNDNGIPDYLDTDNTPTELPDQAKDEPEPDATSTQDEQAKPEEQPAAKPEDKADNKPEKTESADDKKPAEDTQEDTEKDTKDDSSKVTLDTSDDSGSKGNISKARLYFPFRSSEPELADSVAEYFDLIIKQLKDNPDVEIKVTGHTDSVGRGAANRRLGRQRAEQVRDMLVKRGAPKSQITVDSKGEGEPIADNKTDAGRKKNRRVELEQVE